MIAPGSPQILFHFLSFFFLESSSATTFANSTVPAIAAADNTFQSHSGIFLSLHAALAQPLLRL